MDTNPCLCILINSVMGKQEKERRARLSKTVHFSVSMWCTFSRCFERLLVFPPLHAKNMLHYGNKRCLHQYLWGITTLLKVWLSLPLTSAVCLHPCLCCCVCEVTERQWEPCTPCTGHAPTQISLSRIRNKSFMDECLNFSSTLSRTVLAYWYMAFLNLTPGPM